MADIDIITATIANGQSLSAQINIGFKSLVAIVMPAGWDAADITFQASPDGGTTFGELYATDGVAADAVAPIQIHSPAAGQFIAIDASQMKAVNCLKIRSGTAAVAVNQTALRTLTLLTRQVS